MVMEIHRGELLFEPMEPHGNLPFRPAQVWFLPGFRFYCVKLKKHSENVKIGICYFEVLKESVTIS